MNNPFVFSAVVVIVVLALVTAVSDYSMHGRVANVVGVFNTCGQIAGLVEVRGDGSVTLYDDDNRASRAKLEELANLPEQKQTVILVPCVQKENQNFEAQSDGPDGDRREVALRW